MILSKLFSPVVNKQSPSERLSLNYGKVHAILSDSRPAMGQLKGYFFIKCLEYGTNALCLTSEQVASENSGNKYTMQTRLRALEVEGFFKCVPTQQGVIYTVDKEYFEGV